MGRLLLNNAHTIAFIHLANTFGSILCAPVLVTLHVKKNIHFGRVSVLAGLLLVSLTPGLHDLLGRHFFDTLLWGSSGSNSSCIMGPIDGLLSQGSLMKLLNAIDTAEIRHLAVTPHVKAGIKSTQHIIRNI